MINPFEGYRVTSQYGLRRSPINGNQEFHPGIDLVKGHREPIYAFVAGEVMFAGEGESGSGFGGYGIAAAIRCPITGHLHVYAHLDSAGVRVGQKVERGQLIGRQGTTGQSTGSHLHYEIRKTSSPQFGWRADRANNTFEPRAYLQEFYKREEEEAMYNELLDKVNSQQKTIDDLQRQVKALESRNAMSVPEWAKEAVQAAAEARLINTPGGGSYDFYRLITVLHRKGLI